MNETNSQLGRPADLGKRLRDLRRGAGLTGTQLAAALGWAQSKVSRIENARQIPSEEDIHGWVREVGGSDHLADELLDLLADMRVAHRTWRQQLHERSLADVQLDYERLDRDASVVRNVEVAVVPGLLQTAEYATHRLREGASWFGLSEADVATAVARRMQGQAILYDTSKRFEFVMTEGVLRTLVCPVEVMLGQLDRLLGLIGLAHVRLGIIPFGIPLKAVPLHGFAMWDDLVVVETYDTELVLRPDDAEVYARIAEELMKSARTGRAAQQLISLAMRDLTPLSSNAETTAETAQ